MEPNDTFTTPIIKTPSYQQQQRPRHSALSDSASSRKQSSFTVRFTESDPSPAPRSPLRPPTPRPKLTRLQIFDPEGIDFEPLYDPHYDDISSIDISSSSASEECAGSGDKDNMIDQIMDTLYADNINATPEKILHDVTPEKKTSSRFSQPSTLFSRFQPRLPLSVANSSSATKTLEEPALALSWLPSPSSPLPSVCTNSSSGARSRIFAASKNPRSRHSNTNRKITTARLLRPSSLRFVTNQASPLEPLPSLSDIELDLGTSIPSDSTTLSGGYTTPSPEKHEEGTESGDDHNAEV
ncbi:hypothetical protein BGX27_005812 [Mortierella sp. AM989]|nr:hypothetical protein BGX27_005812 [Mortierella sp. AM989]